MRKCGVKACQVESVDASGVLTGGTSSEAFVKCTVISKGAQRRRRRDLPLQVPGREGNRLGYE